LVVVFFLCLVTDMSEMVKFCMMVHIGPRQIFSPWGAVPRNPKSEILGLNFGQINLTVNISNGKLQRYMSLELNISSTTAFCKCESELSSRPRGAHKVCVLLTHLSNHFYRAMRCKRSLCCHAVSVRLSVRHVRGSRQNEERYL